MKFAIDEAKCVDCGACRRYCPVDCIPYLRMQHQIDVPRCIGCVICYAVCPADAVVPLAESGPAPDLSWETMERVRSRAFTRGPRQVLAAR